jgi:hypothetical protein
MSMLDWNGYRRQVLSGVGALGKLRQSACAAMAASPSIPKRPAKQAPRKKRLQRPLGEAVNVNAGAALVYSTRTLDAFDAASNA